MDADDILSYPGQPEEKEDPQQSTSQTQVLTNYSKLTLKAKHIHVYRVEIINLDATTSTAIHTADQESNQSPPIIPIREVQEQPIRCAVFQKAQQRSPELQRLVFDEKNYAYSGKNTHKKWKDLEGQQYTLDIPYSTKDFACTFQLLVRHQRSYDVDTLEKYCRGETDLKANSGYIQGMMFALDTVLRLGARVFTDVDGRNVDPAMKINTVCGFDILWAYRFTTKAGRNALYVNVSAKSVPITNQPNLLLLSKALLKTKRDIADEVQSASSAVPVSAWASKVGPILVDLAVQVPGSSDEHRVKAVTTRSAQEQAGPEGDDCSIVQHYKRRFGLHTTDPQAPCAQLADDTLVPLEHCVLSRPQYLRLFRGPAHDHLMLRSAIKPAARMALLQHAIDMLVKAEPRELAAIGMQINQKLETLPAQVLSPPKILGKDRKPLEIQKRQYWSYTVDSKIENSKQLVSWAVVVFASKEIAPLNQISTFVSQLVKTSQDTGLDVRNTQPPIQYAAATSDIKQTLEDACNAASKQAKTSAQLIVCVLPSSSSALYGEIKRVALTVVGVQTQCVRSHNARGANRTKLLSMIALKINIKLGGTSLSLSPKDRPCMDIPTMVVSADVSHNTETRNMSVAAIVSSVDLQASRFQGTVMQHPQRLEYIENYDAIIRQCLRAFYAATRQKPQRIMYYRDGVNDSQMDTVKQLELQAIFKGCSLIEPGYKPKVTMVIARKRHSTRFVLQQQNADEMQNCAAGTVIKDAITSPSIYSFFAASHSSIHGVTKAPYYLVMHDDNNFDPQELRQLTYNLSFTYPISMRTATMPASLYYAHRLSGAGRLQLNHPFNELPRFQGPEKAAEEKEKASSKNKKKKKKQAEPEFHLVPVHKNIEGTMYFM
ncbi:hypothetical protein FB645_002058 [Coemansia sp. IMI 203386]|nr:hypothetical protein FB645_002058 [Coemansia sp. IMI 203386]